MYITDNAINPKLVLDKNTIGNRHLWKGPLGGLSAHKFISEAFKSRLDEFRPALDFVRCEEVVAGLNDVL